MLIREIILENFMSYEYARIPLKPGINIICGPNGAGKSSIVLGISVALGQSYTERSKKLSDLIRWGKDIGRVTLVLDNSKRKGRRPVSRIVKDQIFLTRILRRDGKYWFEVDNVHATKSDVLRLLSHFDIDPDNMLIIMHQDMAEQFIVLSPQEKLKLVESAAGLEPYRRNVLEAQKKLSRILSQEESLSKMLESAEQTLNFWREQYDRYQQKKQLMVKRRFLERELAWAEVARREEKITELEKLLHNKKVELEKIEKAISRSEEDVKNLSNEFRNAKDDWQRLFEERLSLEREKARHEFNVLNNALILAELKSWVEQGKEKTGELLEGFITLQERLKKLNLDVFESWISESKKVSEELDKIPQMMSLRLQDLNKSVEDSRLKILGLDTQISDTRFRMDKISLELEKLSDEIVEKRIELGILHYRRQELSKEAEETAKNIETLKADLAASISKAEAMGPRIAVLRTVEEVTDEIRMVDGRISAMADVSEDVERMYESYSKLYFELKEKARVTAENREMVLEEIKTRMDAWRSVIRNLIEHINLQYQKFLSQANATGFVQLINEHDIEATGIEILVGFKRSKPLPLSIYSQSGGERSTAVMAFLLALQQHIKSPFRAVDEYDIHMDPKNREVIANLLISAVEGGEAQYLAITPNQMFFEGKDIHIITVQNIEGVSLVREVS